MTQMKRERSYLPQDFFVDRFVSGLKDSIKHSVQCQKPATLLSAYWYARQYEKAYLSTTKKNLQLQFKLLDSFLHRPIDHLQQEITETEFNWTGSESLENVGTVLTIGLWVINDSPCREP
jgi:hypothetical protein